MMSMARDGRRGISFRFSCSYSQKKKNGSCSERSWEELLFGPPLLTREKNPLGESWRRYKRHPRWVLAPAVCGSSTSGVSWLRMILILSHFSGAIFMPWFSIGYQNETLKKSVQEKRKRVKIKGSSESICLCLPTARIADIPVVLVMIIVVL